MMNQLSQNSYTQPLIMDKQLVYTDEDLIERFQNGDEQAYIELVNRNKDRLMNFDTVSLMITNNLKILPKKLL